MANYKLMTALAVASSLGLSGMALAEGHSSADDQSGVYVEGGLGYNILQGDKGYKQGINNATQAAVDASNDINATSTAASKKSQHFAGRAALGYQFNPYVALEAGFDYLGNNKYSGTFSELSSTYNYNAKTSAIAYDLAAKGILPLSMVSDSLANANLFAKAGAALVGVKSSYTDSYAGTTTGVTKRKYNITPELGAGAGYNFDNGLGLNVSYTYIFGKKKIGSNAAGPVIPTNFVPSSNLIMAGVSYRFAV